MHMYSTGKLVLAPIQATPRAGAQTTGLQSIEGTIQRIDYRERKLALVADSRVWHFTLRPGSQLWFNGRLTIFRCFHPLDHVQISYEVNANELVAQVLRMSARES